MKQRLKPKLVLKSMSTHWIYVCKESTNKNVQTTNKNVGMYKQNGQINSKSYIRLCQKGY